MDLMYLVTTADADKVLLPLLQASRRRGIAWGCFFTNDGVRVLENATVRDLMSFADSAVACELSWERYGGGACPVNSGSQTNNSAMAAQAKHLISL